MSKKFDEFYNVLCNKDYYTLFNIYKDVILSLFEWKGLPEGISSEKLEEYLFTNGQAGFFELFDSTGSVKGLTALPSSDGGNYNIHDEPLDFVLSGRGWTKRLSAKDVVLIKNNNTKTPSADIIDYYIRKINNLEGCKFLNTNAMKLPFLLKVNNKKTQLTLLNFFESVALSKPAIVVDESISNEDVNVFDTKVECRLSELSDDINRYKNDILTYFGIDNISIDKAERLVTSEADANDEIIDDNITKMFKCRLMACKEINKKFGLNVSVKFMNNYKEKEGNKDGKIHNNSEGNEGTKQTTMAE